MTMWVAVTADEYELPVLVEDSAQALADKLGLVKGTIYAMIYRHNTSLYKYNGQPYRVVRVEVDG